MKKQRTSLVVAAAAKVAPLFHFQEVQGSNLKNVLLTGPQSFVSTFCSTISSFFIYHGPVPPQCNIRCHSDGDADFYHQTICLLLFVKLHHITFVFVYGKQYCINCLNQKQQAKKFIHFGALSSCVWSTGSTRNIS